MSYDIYLDPSAAERKPFGFGLAQAAKVTGLTRVAQRFLKFLLTPEGSDPSQNIQGTRLPWLLLGDVADPMHLKTVATIAVNSAAEQVRALTQTPGVEGPDLVDAHITDLKVGLNKLDIYLKLMTTAGVATLRLPLQGAGSVQNQAPIIASYSAMLQSL